MNVNKNTSQAKRLLVVATMVVLLTALPDAVWAHCDTESGPTAVDARKALETGDFKKAAIWIGEKQTAELRESFEESLAVYKMGGKAKKLAERYFMSTAVRLHREAEGMSFTGLKPAQPLPVIYVSNLYKTVQAGPPHGVHE